MVNIPDELKLSISPGFLVPVSGSIKRTRTKYKTQRGNRPTLLNGPTNTLPEQRKLRHIKSIHFRNLLPTKPTLPNCYYTLQPFSGTSLSCSFKSGDILYKSDIIYGTLVSK